MDISVVIPTWNGANRITATLTSLANQTLEPERFEVVVSDDGSQDRTHQVVQDFGSLNPRMNLRCVRIRHGGVNAARNAGITAATGELIVLMDDDEQAPKDHLARVAQSLADRPDLAGVGGPAVLEGPSFRTCDQCRIGEATLPVTDAGMTCRLLGGNMAVRRELIEEVGLFDADISGRGDENEWFHRAQRQFWYDESLFVWHRRDHYSLPGLLATGFRQGLSVPLAAQRMGNGDWQPSARRLVRYLGHGLSNACVNGFLQAARELGSTATWARMRFRRLGAAEVEPGASG